MGLAPGSSCCGPAPRQASVTTRPRPHRAAPLPALVRAVHARDPEVRRHGCGLQPAEAQAGDPVCVRRVPPALHGTDPGGSRVERGRAGPVGGQGQCLGWSVLPGPPSVPPGLEDTEQPGEEKKVSRDNATEEREEEVAAGNSHPTRGAGQRGAPPH